ncbi:hypothetical protein QQF64_027549 [Cirrhinus molitorella]|uniref:Arb2 domain-containing protein n=1 Tax=Cirrhinus molitorella TaxID=172907 RepID=A0ABR3NDH0_9TELE
MAQLLAQEEKEKTTALKDLLSRIDLDELMKKDEPPLNFPETLNEFEYAFNEHGQLRHIQTGEPFVFNYKEDLHRWNQKRYEALGEIITKYVYQLLENDCNLKKEILPVDATEDEPKSFIYVSEDALTNPEKIMVLIQGSGVVRAGQWARRLIINEDLDSGTQIPFINRAKECREKTDREGEFACMCARETVRWLIAFAKRCVLGAYCDGLDGKNARMTEGMWLSLCNICIAEGVRMRRLILQVTARVCDFLCDKQGHLRPCAECALIRDQSVLLASDSSACCIMVAESLPCDLSKAELQREKKLEKRKTVGFRLHWRLEIFFPLVALRKHE